MADGLQIIQKFTKGQTKLPVIGEIPNIVLAGGALLLAGLGYYAFTNKGGGLNINGAAGPGDVTNTAPADSIYVRVVPDKVRPADYTTLAGAFLDAQKKATKVKTGYYRVLEDDNTAKGTQNIKANGTLGNDIAQFVIQISTNEYRDGKSYTVEVSDNPEFM